MVVTRRGRLRRVEKLCAIQCTEEEIAGVFGCCVDTLYEWCKREYNETFSEVYKKYSADGKKSLRRYQFALAKTNATMAIWLGKQWLGQRDRVEVDGGEKPVDVQISIEDCS